MRGVEQIPWLYGAGMVLLEKTGLGRWRSWLAGGVGRGRVLDLGCGTGRNLPLFGEGVRAVGLDPCHESLLKARRRAPGVPLVRARAEALPFRDRVFDTVVSGLVFCSVGDVPRGLHEVRRVLKPTGRLRVLEHVRSESRLAGWLQDVTQPACTLEPRTKGTPQGGVISPLLANLFLHYAFDVWRGRHFVACRFERYADDGAPRKREGRLDVAVN